MATDAHMGLRLYVAGVCAVGFGLSLFALQTVTAPVGQPFLFHWAALGLGFAFAERFSTSIEVRREAHALTFTEVPLTLGLIFATPGDFLLARILFSTVAMWAFRRPPLIKVAFNAGQFALDAGIALLVFNAVLGDATPVDPLGWVAALVAVATSHLVCAVAVSIVMRLAGAPVTPRSQLGVVGVSLSSALAGTAVALGASGALWRDGRYWVLLALIGGALGYFFIAFMRIRERHQSLSALHQFTSVIADAEDATALLENAAVGVADLLRASRSVLLVPSGPSLAVVEFEDGQIRVDSHQVEDVNWVAALSAHSGAVQPATKAIGGVHLLTATSIAAPLPLPDQTGLVVVDGRLSNARGFDDEDVQLLETAAGHAASALHNAQLVERLREEAAFRARQALHDEITDLPNQRALVEDLNEELAGAARFVMLTVRIHSLREVNETLGRAVGDEMLRHVAARLQSVATDARCARSGTDEFTLVVPGGESDADELANRIVEAFESTILCSGVALAVTVGVGVALAPQHGTEAEILLRRASLAASRSAIEGTTVTTWAADRDPYDPNRLKIAADLRDAIPAGELEVHFQPQLDMTRNRIMGAEALVRWAHPRLGQLRPDQFIAAAEHTGAIDALTAHVVEVSARTGRRWHDLGWDLDIAVNLSARNLASPRFAALVADILDTTGFPAASLTLELTESSVMTEAERALKTLHELHDLGIALSIDDFGTGYSSLAHLRRLPVNEIKIDKSFVFDLTTNESDEAIVRSMIDLGKTLSLTVVVEGVETVEVRDRLQQLGADRLQGYLLSRPLAASAFEHWLQERQPRDTPAVGRVVNLHGPR